jgi:hypothetical protein
VAEWQNNLKKLLLDAESQHNKTAWQKTANWWQQYWDRSFVYINPQNNPDTLPHGKPAKTTSCSGICWAAMLTDNIPPNLMVAYSPTIRFL